MNGPQLSPRVPRGVLPNSSTTTSMAQQQPITVRVMRLSRPCFTPNSSKLPVPACGASLDSLPENSQAVFGDELVVPSVFGRVAVGEQLCFLVSLVNTSSADVKSLKVRVDLQKRHQPNAGAFLLVETLADTTASPIAALKSGQRLEFACSTTVKEPTLHSLACTVYYDRIVMNTDPVSMAAMGGQPMVPPTRPATPEIHAVPTSYTKHFNFSVAKNVQLTTRTSSLFPAGGHTWLVEATVECFVPVHITKICLCPDSAKPEICVEDIAGCVGSEVSSAVPSSTTGAKWNLDGFPEHLPRFRDVKGMVKDQSVLRKTFRVTLNNGVTQLPNRIGVLKVEWCGSNCERGSVEQVVERDSGKEKNAKMDGIDVIVEKESDSVELYQSFDVTCTIKNNSRSPVSLLIAYNETRELTPALISSLTATFQSSMPAAGSSYGATLAVSLESPTTTTAPSSKQQNSSAQPEKQQQQMAATPQSSGMIINGTTCDPDPIVIPSGGQHKHTLSLLPVQLGLCSLGSLLFYDTNTGAATPCSDIGTIFVKSS